MESIVYRDRYADFFGLVEKTFSPHSVQMISDAFDMAASALAGMVRYDDTPLLDHSVRTAEIVVREIGLGRNSTIATILHDAVRLGLIDPAEINKRYGEAPVAILEGLNLISKVKTKVSATQADNFRDLIISYANDPRVMLIKLADRLEVMRSLVMFPEAKRKKKSWESMNLYAQIAHKLGLYSIKSELEDISLSWLEPESYVYISRRLEETAKERDSFIAGFIAPIHEKLNEQGIKHHIKGRTKSVYSIWRKMKRTGIAFDDIYDIFAIRVVIDCPREQEKQLCWSVYSVVTDFYTPNPERMRDWISIPKSNGYESLHTTVVTKEGHWVEIQIRSERMDEVAEKGIAAHWRYKGVHGASNRNEEWLSRLREIMEESNNRNDISTKIDTSASSDEVFVFTPDGDLKKLPKGATVLDFAFDIHTDVGESCTGAKIGDRVVSIKERLGNGDIVSIIRSKNQKPKADWLNYVVTSKARNKIKASLRDEEMRVAKLGREELERKIKNWKLAITIDDAVIVLTKYYKYRTGTQLYVAIAAGTLNIADTKEVISRYISGELFEPKIRTAAVPKQTTGKGGDDALIIDDSIRGLDYKFAKCCNPIFGDEVFGFTTVSSGITIHKRDCPNAARLHEQYGYRIRAVMWRSGANQGAFVATVRVVAKDTTGMVNKITDVITVQFKMNVRSMSISPLRDGNIGGTINFEVPNTAMLDMVVATLNKTRDVEKAYRVNS